MARRATLCGALAALLVATVAWSADPRIAVIVHPDRHVRLEAEDVARIFLKQRRFWEDGAPIVPLNREAGSDLREAFSQSVFGESGAALAGYWNEQYFLGRFPPAILSSSAAVKRFVASEPSAIGYVEASVVDETVQAILELSGKHPKR